MSNTSELILTIRNGNKSIQIVHPKVQPEIKIDTKPVNIQLQIIELNRIIKLNGAKPSEIILVDSGKQGLVGAQGKPGVKGDPLKYEDLTLEAKVEMANLFPINYANFNTDLLASYILEKD